MLDARARRMTPCLHPCAPGFQGAASGTPGRPRAPPAHRPPPTAPRRCAKLRGCPRAPALTPSVSLQRGGPRPASAGPRRGWTSHCPGDTALASRPRARQLEQVLPVPRAGRVRTGTGSRPEAQGGARGPAGPGGLASWARPCRLRAVPWPPPRLGFPAWCSAGRGASAGEQAGGTTAPGRPAGAGQRRGDGAARRPGSGARARNLLAAQLHSPRVPGRRGGAPTRCCQAACTVSSLWAAGRRGAHGLIGRLLWGLTKLGKLGFGEAPTRWERVKRSLSAQRLLRAGA